MYKFTDLIKRPWVNPINNQGGHVPTLKLKKIKNKIIIIIIIIIIIDIFIYKKNRLIKCLF